MALADGLQIDRYTGLRLSQHRHLRTLHGSAIKDTYITPFTSSWTSEQPDEMPLKNGEQLWELELLDEHISKQLKNLNLI